MIRLNLRSIAVIILIRISSTSHSFHTNPLEKRRGMICNMQRKDRGGGVWETWEVRPAGHFVVFCFISPLLLHSGSLRVTDVYRWGAGGYTPLWSMCPHALIVPIKSPSNQCWTVLLPCSQLNKHPHRKASCSRSLTNRVYFPGPFFGLTLIHHLHHFPTDVLVMNLQLNKYERNDAWFK